MRGFLVFIIFLALIGVYLNRAYAHFYDSRGNKILPKTTQESYDVGIGFNFIKLVSLGDSLTAGVGATKGENSYPYLVAKNLSAGNSDVLLYDVAESGAESEDVLKSQVERAISRRPDIIIILIGLNDLHNQVPENTFRENYRKIISKLKNKTQAKIALINIPYLGSGKILFFPYNFLLEYKTGVFNQIIKQLALDENLIYIDLYSKTKNDFGSDNSMYAEDNFHPSDKGYLLWGQIINANISK